MLGGNRRHLKIRTFLRMEKEMQPTPVGLPGKSHGQRSLADYNPRGHKRVRRDLATKQQHDELFPNINFLYSASA